MSNWRSTFCGIAPGGAEVGVGVYNLQAGGGARNQAWGPQFRGDLWLTEHIATFANYSYDRVFNHSFNGGVAVYWGGPSVSACARSECSRSRLWAPVQRRHIIPVVNYNEGTPDLLAHDANTGTLITLTHVDGAGAAGGDGTAEDPYQQLVDASLSGTDIVLVQPEVYAGDSIVLSDNQRLLAASKLHAVDTRELGVIDLPGTGLGGTTVIVGSPGDAITIGNNAEVRGFLIAGAAGNGIFGQNVTGYDINCNTILAGAENGIFIDVQPGNGPSGGDIWDNIIAGHVNRGTAGILINSPDDEVTAQIYENTVDGNAAGIIVRADWLHGDIYDNTVINSISGPGIGLFSNMHLGDVINNVVTNNAEQGILVATNSVPGPLNVTGNDASGNGQDGISIDILGDGPGVDLNVEGNTANGNGRHGINVESQGNEDLNGVVASNFTNGNAGFGVVLTTNTALGTGSVNTVVSGNEALGNGLSGIGVSSAAGVHGDVFGNTANGNADFGVWVSAAEDTTSDVNQNTSHGNGLGGIHVNAGRDLLGNVVDNRANGNGGPGIEAVVGRDVVGDAALNQVAGNQDAGILYQVGRDFTGDIVANVADNTIGGDGVNVSVVGNYSGNVLGNAAANNDGNGLSLNADFIVAGAGDYLAGGNVLINNGGNGLVLVSGTDLIGDMVSNTASENDGNGILLVATDTILTTFADNTTNDNLGGGILVLSTDYSGDIPSNTAGGNAADGIAVVTSGDITTLVADNNGSANGAFGISLEAGGDFLGSVIQNLAAGNVGAGVYVEADNAISLPGSALARQNTTFDNGLSGLVFIANSDISGDITDNTTYNNGFAGPSNGMTMIAGDTYTGSLTGNVANDNAVDGMGISVAGFVGNVFENEAFGNGSNGIRITTTGDFAATLRTT